MSKLTEVLTLFCYDPETDGNLTFNVTEALTKNWEKIDQLVLLAVAAAATYDPEGSYAVGDYCTNGGKLHKCGTAIPDGEPWTAEHWTETSVAEELAEVRASLSNKLSLSGGTMVGPIKWPYNQSFGIVATVNQMEWLCGPLSIRLIPENAVGNDISKCAAIRETASGTMHYIATTTPLGRENLPLASGWNGWVHYYKDQFNNVLMYGLIYKNTGLISGDVIANLPADLFPTDVSPFPITSSTGINNTPFATSGYVQPNGKLILSGGTIATGYVTGSNLAFNFVYQAVGG